MGVTPPRGVDDVFPLERYTELRLARSPPRPIQHTTFSIDTPSVLHRIERIADGRERNSLDIGEAMSATVTKKHPIRIRIADARLTVPERFRQGTGYEEPPMHEDETMYPAS